MASNFNDPINILDSSNATGIGSGGSLNLRGGASIGKDLYIGGNVNISGTTTAFSDNIILSIKIHPVVAILVFFFKDILVISLIIKHILGLFIQK
jgi:hypothetical protein